MGDLGSNGVVASLPPVVWIERGTRQVAFGRHVSLSIGAGRDETAGSPSPPSFRFHGKGWFGPVEVPITTLGSHEVAIRVRYSPAEAPTPRVVLDATPVRGGVVTATASVSTDWVNVSLPFTALAEGVVDLWVEVRHPLAYLCWIDEITVT